MRSGGHRMPGGRGRVGFVWENRVSGGEVGDAGGDGGAPGAWEAWGRDFVWYFRVFGGRRCRGFVSQFRVFRGWRGGGVDVRKCGRARLCAVLSLFRTSILPLSGLAVALELLEFAEGAVEFAREVGLVAHDAVEGL